MSAKFKLATLYFSAKKKEPKMIDFTKPVQTRDGRKVELLTTNGRGEFCVIGYVGKEESPRRWDNSGNHYLSVSDLTLENVPESIKCFINIHQLLQSQLYTTSSFLSAKEAKKHQKWMRDVYGSDVKLITYKKITCTEGEGL